MAFQVCEFHDGVQAVPSKWINDSDKVEKTCLYPPYSKDTAKVLQDIIKLAEPKSDWITYTVIRFLGRPTDEWSEAMEKEKLAQKFSDIDSDNEKRKIRAAKCLDYSSQSTGENIQTETMSKCKKKHVSKHISNVPKLPEPPTTSIVKTREIGSSSFQHMAFYEDSPEKSLDNLFQPENSETVETPPRRSPRKHLQFTMSEPMTRKAPHKSDRVTSLLTEILRRQNSMALRMTNMERMLEGLKGTFPPNVAPTTVDCFPLKTAEDLQNFEGHCQNNPDYICQCVNTLKSLGGGNLSTLVALILKRVLDNSLAVQYSLCGRKKQGFKELSLYKVVILTAKTVKQEATDKEIDSIVGRWLIQAKLRQDRSKKMEEEVDGVDL